MLIEKPPKLERGAILLTLLGPVIVLGQDEDYPVLWRIAIGMDKSHVLNTIEDQVDYNEWKIQKYLDAIMRIHQNKSKKISQDLSGEIAESLENAKKRRHSLRKRRTKTKKTK